MFKKVIKVAIGISIIPFCIGFSKVYIHWISSLNTISDNQMYFIYGLIIYLIIHLIFRKPFKVYVLGHELTHAFWSKVFGGEVKSLKVTKEGGEVKITKSNFFITLAPYFFPLYTFITLFLFWLFSFFVQDINSLLPYFLFILGFTLSFHILLTLEMIRFDQPDIEENGFIFSCTLIYLINLIIISGLTKIVFINDHSYISYLTKSISESSELYKTIYVYLMDSGLKISEYFKNLYTV